jgi:hypothetical protein
LPEDQSKVAWDPFILEQDRVWIDRDGTVHRLEDMTHEYRAAVLALLRDCASQVWIVYHACSLMRLVEDVALRGSIPGELLASDLGVVPTHMMQPDVWLDSTPLVRALRRLERPT